MRLTVTAATPQSWKWHGGQSQEGKTKTQKLTVYHPDGSTSTVIKEKKNDWCHSSGRYGQCR
ncbi:hypothetical protein MUTS15_24730 [Escherichia coli]|nr:hypothetical protein MUTS15_24730 [Escherichia coli]BDZ02416.1 hypothetical protein MUTS16_34890 [Escherichia coli]